MRMSLIGGLGAYLIAKEFGDLTSIPGGKALSSKTSVSQANVKIGVILGPPMSILDRVEWTQSVSKFAMHFDSVLIRINVEEHWWTATHEGK